MTSVTVPSFFASTIGIVVYFGGARLNKRIGFLRAYNIPEPVTGGLVAASITWLLYLAFEVEITYELDMRDTLLVYFFAAIGLNARVSDLVTGGRPLLILAGLTLFFIVVQNVIGVSSARFLGLPAGVGVLAGSASLIGGHGTAIAWAPELATAGIDAALEIGVASATLGLVLASLVGGPIARVLIQRNQLKSVETDRIVGIAYDKEDRQEINHLDFMAVILAIQVAIIGGWFMHAAIQAMGFKLPLFVTCLLTGIILSNTVPLLVRGIRWPARTPALAVVSDFSLGIFLAMSLMSMQLWTIAALAGPLLAILVVQTLAAVAFTLFVLFPLMGKDYQAAVLCAGFGGFALGATPTAIANMTAVTKANGPAPVAFIMLPLVAAFFVDIANSFVIRAALAW